jgi:hypothetical protein
MHFAAASRLADTSFAVNKSLFPKTTAKEVSANLFDFLSFPDV